ncbi:60s acidic ribosomal protein-domain-containing protein [Boletus reticuloceps]|uniref:60s acidic ribosomal protein-domain-containing protein n=1 Tax=Boletus reticuloceps TaxID=495285 RepID=A0A8I2YJU5_9AGAM|nr:60s acidic ribosomal protein-domain-containing protein [Boletus reticuloceps]
MVSSRYPGTVELSDISVHLGTLIHHHGCLDDRTSLEMPPRNSQQHTPPSSSPTTALKSRPDKIIALTNAADVDLEPIWATLLAKALEGKNVKDLLSNVGAGGGAPAVGVAPVGGGGGAPAATADEPKEEEKKEEKEESDDDMGFGLFD